MYDRAIKINHNYTEAYHGKAIALSALGRGEEAIVMRNRAIELNADFVKHMRLKEQV